MTLFFKRFFLCAAFFLLLMPANADQTSSEQGLSEQKISDTKELKKEQDKEEIKVTGKETPAEHKTTADQQTLQKTLEKKQEGQRIKKIFKKIHERNETLKKSPEWLKEAYSSIKIKKLNDIPKEKYKTYKKYLSGDDVYIIVHPGFDAYFDNKAHLPPEGEGIAGYPEKNVAERTAKQLSSADLALRITYEQERLVRDFVEFMSVEKKLVILILAKDYKKNLSSGYKPGLDEYARYINELTNMSDSIIYMESVKYDSGALEKNELEMLVRFLNDIETKDIMLGGGYLGECLNDFYGSIREKFGYDTVILVPEILVISPHGMVTDSIKLMTKSGKINFKAVLKYLRLSFNISGDKGWPRVKYLPFYNPYRLQPGDESE